MARKVVLQRNFNYYNKVTITNGQYGATNPDIVIGPMILAGVIFQNETASSVLSYSFDGLNEHGQMDSAKDSKSLTFTNRQISTVWFKVISGGPITLRIEAWGDR